MNQYLNLLYKFHELYRLIVCKIGKKGEIAAETEAILRELDLDSAPVPESLNKYLPPLPYTISQQEIDSRLDLR